MYKNNYRKKIAIDEKARAAIRFAGHRWTHGATLIGVYSCTDS